MFSGQPFPAAVTSMNAYYGAGPIVRALDMGAEIIITGKYANHSLHLSP
jgi:Acyclic terpene utilisation family protein AtuA